MPSKFCLAQERCLARNIGDIERFFAVREGNMLTALTVIKLDTEFII